MKVIWRGRGAEKPLELTRPTRAARVSEVNKPVLRRAHVSTVREGLQCISALVPNTTPLQYHLLNHSGRNALATRSRIATWQALYRRVLVGSVRMRANFNLKRAYYTG